MSKHQAGSLRGKVIDLYREHYSCDPVLVVHAPGRINLIGEHTDYNEGFVMPAAIPSGIWIAIGDGSSKVHKCYAADTDEVVEIPLVTNHFKGPGWSAYVHAAMQVLWEYPAHQHPVQCVFASDLPMGAGLSSSSALTCGFLLALNTLYRLEIPRDALAWLAHRAEHDIIGLQGGIMDQYACLLATRDHFLFLDCQDRSYEHIPFHPNGQAHLFLINSNVQHKLTETEYNTRAQECQQAFAVLRKETGIEDMRRLTELDPGDYAAILNPVLARRITFVRNENLRVLMAFKALRTEDWKKLGSLLSASHRGLRDEYEVSCPELDFLVDEACDDDRILGARMMGGGFGGCTINLASSPPDRVFLDDLQKKYAVTFGREPAYIPVQLAPGASIEEISPL